MKTTEEGSRQRNLQYRIRPGFITVVAILLVFFLLWINSFFSRGTDGPGSFPPSVVVEMQELKQAIMLYEVTYGRFPVSTNLDGLHSNDFTFGTFGTSAANFGITNASGYQANNSEVMAILMDWAKFPDGRDTPNADHLRNPEHIAFLDGQGTRSTNLPGLGPDGVFRDPWGNPYIISIDLNGDGRCRDAFYRMANVSEKNSALQEGLGGLSRATPIPYDSSASRDSFEFSGTVMIWSLGPDGKADRSNKADEGANKDNSVSWISWRKR